MRGFSLIEVMVVIAILGVAAALAVPNMLPEIHKAQLDGETEAIANLLARARNEAMLSKRCTRVRITNAAGATQTSGSIFVAERENSFDCEALAPAQANGLWIDGSGAAANAFLSIEKFQSEFPSVSFSFLGADGGRYPAAPGGNEVRFRPNGRVFSNDLTAAGNGNVPKLDNDDAIVVVKHAQLVTEHPSGSTRKILVNSNGLICALPAGITPAGGPTDFNCP